MCTVEYSFSDSFRLLADSLDNAAEIIERITPEACSVFDDTADGDCSQAIARLLRHRQQEHDSA